MTNLATNDPIQNYIKQIQAEYAAAEAYIEAIDKDSSSILHDDSQIAHLESSIDYHMRTSDGMYTESNDYRHKKEEINNLKFFKIFEEADISKQREQLEKLDPSFKALDDTLQGLLNSIDALLPQNVGGKNVSEDVVKVQQWLSKLFTAMNDKLQADKYQALIQNDIGARLSDAQLEAFAAQMIQAESAEQNELMNLIDTLSDDVLAYHKQYDNAKADKASYNILDEAFGGAGAAEYEDERIMANAKGMVQAITTMINNLTPEVSTLMPEFAQINIVLQEVMRKVMKIIEDVNLSPKEKQGQILSLMMFILGFFNLVQQEAQSEKANNQKLMSKANGDVVQMNIDDAVMNQKIQEEEAENAKVMKTVMFAAKLTMGVIFTLLAPGLGSALLMAALTAAETSGGPTGDSAIDKLTASLANAIGSQTAAEILVTVMEVAITAGGGGALDQAIAKGAQKAAQTAVKTAMDSAENAFQAAALQAAAAAGKAGDSTAIQAARETISKTAKQAAQKAAEDAYKQLFNQPILGVFGMFAKGTSKTIAAAATDAAITAAEDASLIAELAASGIVVTKQEMAAVADRAANEAVANASNKSLNDVTKESNKSALTKAGTRAFWSGLYGTASNNLLVEMALKILKDEGKDASDKEYQDTIMAMQTLQGLIAMIAQMFGSGALSQATFENSTMNSLTRIANLASMAPQGANSMANLGMYEVDESQADAVKGLQLSRSLGDILQSSLDQMSKDANLERDRFISMLQQEIRSNAAMEGHLHDGDIAGIRVLSQAV